MLSIGALSLGHASYYAQLSKEDEHARDEEWAGVWWGEGARHIGLSGTVREEDLSMALRGLSPQSGVALTQRREDREKSPHQAGWDLTFSAPKSVSVLWALGDPSTREKIEQAQRIAVEAALETIENEFTLARRGKAGRIREQCDLTVALFQHSTSRALDPQLHTHALVLNMGLRQDLTLGALVSRPLYEQKKTLGAIYRTQLAHEMRERLNVAIEPDGESFRISEVPRSVCVEFSRRRTTIEQDLARAQRSGGAAAAIAALSTREAKTASSSHSLLADWQSRAQSLGFDLASPQAQTSEPLEGKKSDLEALQKRILASCSERALTRNELLRVAADFGQIHGISSRDVCDAVDRATRPDGPLVGQMRNGWAYYSNRGTAARLEAIERNGTEQSRRGEGGRVRDLIASDISRYQSRGFRVVLVTDRKSTSEFAKFEIETMSVSKLKETIGFEESKGAWSLALDQGLAYLRDIRIFGDSLGPSSYPTLREILNRYGPDILAPLKTALAESERNARRFGPDITQALDALRSAAINRIFNPTEPKGRTAYLLIDKEAPSVEVRMALSEWCQANQSTCLQYAKELRTPNRPMSVSNEKGAHERRADGAERIIERLQARNQGHER